MFGKYFLPFLAFLGALLGLYIVHVSQKEMPVPEVLYPPARSPYAHSIAATGIIEASSQNISVGSPYNEIIEEIYVKAGDFVKAGDKLFKLDTRNFEAQKAAAEANLKLAQITMENQKTQFSFYERLKDVRSVSEQLFQQTRYSFLQAQENFNVSQANLTMAQVGIERSTIYAPLDGQILRVNAHIGEIAPIIPTVSAQSTWKTANYGTLILLGTIEPLQLRIDVDEDDAWKFQPDAPATAFVRGNRHIHFPLTYVKTEPYIIPKRSFTGDTVERVDTRVLQVLYNFEKGELPIYAGQILDVFIETKPVSEIGL